MYNPAHFSESDMGVLHEFVRNNVFATFAGTIGGAIHFAYAPVVIDAEPSPGAVRFHFARANPIAEIGEGAILKFSIVGPHCYISPDWYETPGMVPTWNYVAVEGSGRLHRLNEAGLIKLLHDLAAQEERLLLPKAPWMLGNIGAERLSQLLPAIAGFELVFDSLEGKAKLSQNRSQADIAGAIAALDRRSDPSGRAVASAMRKTSLR